MRWTDRPAPQEREPGSGADRLARRLDALPPAHPSAADYEYADESGDVAADAAEDAGLAGDDPVDDGTADDAVQAVEEQASEEQEREPGRVPPGEAGRHPPGRIVLRSGGEPYRPWFTVGGPAEPWFTDGPADPPG